MVDVVHGITIFQHVSHLNLSMYGDWLVVSIVRIEKLTSIILHSHGGCHASYMCLTYVLYTPGTHHDVERKKNT